MALVGRSDGPLVAAVALDGDGRLVVVVVRSGPVAGGSDGGVVVVVVVVGRLSVDGGSTRV